MQAGDAWREMGSAAGPPDETESRANPPDRVQVMSVFKHARTRLVPLGNIPQALKHHVVSFLSEILSGAAALSHLLGDTQNTASVSASPCRRRCRNGGEAGTARAS